MSNTVQQPKISVVMVDGAFRERYDSIDFMAKQNLPADRYELIWVEYFDKIDPDLQQRIDTASKTHNFRTITLGRKGHYHSSYCFNRGIIEAKGELLVIPDADVIAEPNFLEKVLQDHAGYDRLVTYYHRYNEPESQRAEQVDIEHLRDVCELTNPSNHGACIATRRKWFIEINGYEQSPIFATGFHANDKDVYARLCSLGLMVRWNPDVKLYHPWHAMTGELTPHYKPQLDVISWRGRTLSTRPFQGLVTSLNTIPPQRYIDIENWLKSIDEPRWKKVAGKLRKIAGIERRAA